MKALNKLTRLAKTKMEQERQLDKLNDMKHLIKNVLNGSITQKKGIKMIKIIGELL